MKTLLLSGGDLALGPTGDARLLGGANKIASDITAFLTSQVGHDRFHPWIGSSLDEFIGGSVSALTLATIRQRVRDTLEIYQANQTEELHRRISAYDDPVIGMAEASPTSLLSRFTEIDVSFDKAQPGTISVYIVFSTIAGDSGYARIFLAPPDELLGITDDNDYASILEVEAERGVPEALPGVPEALPGVPEALPGVPGVFV